MIGAIHRPQRSTRTVWAPTSASPARLKVARIGRRRRSISAVSSTRFRLNRGAAIAHCTTPDSDWA